MVRLNRSRINQKVNASTCLATLMTVACGVVHNIHMAIYPIASFCSVQVQNLQLLKTEYPDISLTKVITLLALRV